MTVNLIHPHRKSSSQLFINKTPLWRFQKPGVRLKHPIGPQKKKKRGEEKTCQKVRASLWLQDHPPRLVQPHTEGSLWTHSSSTGKRRAPGGHAASPALWGALRETHLRTTWHSSVGTQLEKKRGGSHGCAYGSWKTTFLLLECPTANPNWWVCSSAELNWWPHLARKGSYQISLFESTAESLFYPESMV